MPVKIERLVDFDLWVRLWKPLLKMKVRGEIKLKFNLTVKAVYIDRFLMFSCKKSVPIKSFKLLECI